MMIRIDSIKLPTPLRKPSMDVVEELANSNKPIPPICVVQITKNRYRLIDGLHRVLAAKQLGKEDIDANIVSQT